MVCERLHPDVVEGAPVLVRRERSHCDAIRHMGNHGLVIQRPIHGVEVSGDVKPLVLQQVTRRRIACVDQEVQRYPAEWARALRRCSKTSTMADYLEGVESRPVSTPLQPHEIAARFAGPVPRAGRPVSSVSADA